MGNGRIEGSGGAGYNAGPEAPTYPVAVVKNGETTLGQVADRLRAQGTPVDLATLQKLNPHISDSGKLTPGQWIRLPLSAGENAPMVERVSQLPTSSSGSPTLAKDDPMSKTMAHLKMDVQPAGGAGQVTKLTGMSLGSNEKGQDVRVTREIGDPKGYDDELQATAVARMAHTEPAAVIKIDGKYHAVETSADTRYYDGEDYTRNRSVGNSWVHGLPPYSEVTDARNDVIALRTRADELQALRLKNGNQLPKDLQAELDDVAAKLGPARSKLASLMFGVDPSQLQFNRSDMDKVAGKINIAPNIGASGREGPVFKQNTDFKNSKHAIEIDLSQLENPDLAEGTLFHEASHAKDRSIAQDWVKKYEDETHHTFVEGPPGVKAFRDWMEAQTKTHPPRLSEADKQLVVDMAEKDSPTTEARAFVHTALNAILAGAPGVATAEFKGYAANTQPVGKAYANPVNGSEVQADLTREIQAAYQHMTKAQQQQLRDAIDAAKAANPDNWVGQVKLLK